MPNNIKRVLFPDEFATMWRDPSFTSNKQDSLATIHLEKEKPKRGKRQRLKNDEFVSVLMNLSNNTSKNKNVDSLSSFGSNKENQLVRANKPKRNIQSKQKETKIKIKQQAASKRQEEKPSKKSSKVTKVTSKTSKRPRKKIESKQQTIENNSHTGLASFCGLDQTVAISKRLPMPMESPTLEESNNETSLSVSISGNEIDSISIENTITVNTQEKEMQVSPNEQNGKECISEDKSIIEETSITTESDGKAKRKTTKRSKAKKKARKPRIATPADASIGSSEKETQKGRRRSLRIASVSTDDVETFPDVQEGKVETTNNAPTDMSDEKEPVKRRRSARKLPAASTDLEQSHDEKENQAKSTPSIDERFDTMKAELEEIEKLFTGLPGAKIQPIDDETNSAVEEEVSATKPRRSERLSTGMKRNRDEGQMKKSSKRRVSFGEASVKTIVMEAESSKTSLNEAETPSQPRRSSRNAKKTDRFGTYADENVILSEKKSKPKPKKEIVEELTTKSPEQEHQNVRRSVRTASKPDRFSYNSAEKQPRKIDRTQRISQKKKKSQDVDKSNPTSDLPSIDKKSIASTDCNESTWDAYEMILLREAQREVDPTSRTFWEEVSDLVGSRSAVECREKWFAMVKTPVVRAIKSKKAEINDKSPQTPHDDDIFNATPMKVLFSEDTLEPEDNFENIPSLSNLGLGSAIKVDRSESHYIDVPAQRGFKTYITNMRRNVLKPSKGKKARDPATLMKTGKSLREREDDGDVEMNARLSPGGTLRVNTNATDSMVDDYMETTFDEGDEVYPF